MKTWLALLAAALLAILPAPILAQTFPAFTGLVTDAAGVLRADRKAALEGKLESFQQQTGRQLVVATVPDLQGYSIEDYGYRLGRSWGVGLKGADNGAILLVAPKERKVRIEVGYRLEPVLTDALSSVIIQGQVVPRFKAGDLPGGIEAGTDAIAEQLRLPDEQARAQVAKAAAEFDRTHKRGAGGGVPLGLIFWGLVLGFVLLSFLRRRGGPGVTSRYGGGGGSNWPIWLWAADELTRGRGGGWGGGSSWGGGDGGGGGSDGSWGGGGFTGGGGGSFGGGGSSGSW